MEKERGADRFGIFLIDAHEGARRALARLIGAEPELAVCGEASSLDEALSRLPDAKADAVVANFDPLNGGGVAAVSRLRQAHPALPIVTVTMRGVVHERSLLQAGVAGLVAQHEAARDIVAALHRVLEGGIYIGKDGRVPRKRKS